MCGAVMVTSFWAVMGALLFGVVEKLLARSDGNITAVMDTPFWVVDGGIAAWGDGASLPIRSLPVGF